MIQKRFPHYGHLDDDNNIAMDYNIVKRSYTYMVYFKSFSKFELEATDSPKVLSDNAR